MTGTTLLESDCTLPMHRNKPNVGECTKVVCSQSHGGGFCLIKQSRVKVRNAISHFIPMAKVPHVYNESVVGMLQLEDGENCKLCWAWQGT